MEAGKRYVALAGGADKVVAAAQQAFDAGDFRWAAELLKHAVYADPKNARRRRADGTSFEQMGYMAESAPWRNFYLTGALELRQGPPDKGSIPRSALLDMLQHTPIERFLRGDGRQAERRRRRRTIQLKINLVFSDLRRELRAAGRATAVLHHHKAPPAAGCQRDAAA